ncbi:MAG: helix-turn-helix domain-containing protein, partial [Ktedonobacteraceae bacterium]
AMRVFTQKGFSRATNRDVAREAGITTGLIYYYFDNKEALLRAVLDAHSPVQITTQITPEMLEHPPELLMPLLVMRVLAIAEGEQFVSIIRMMLPETVYNSAISPIALGFFQRVLDFLGHYLHIQIAKGTVRVDINPELVVQVLVSSLIGFVLRRQIIHDPSALAYTHAEIAQVVVSTFLQGIQPH